MKGGSRSEERESAVGAVSRAAAVALLPLSRAPLDTHHARLQGFLGGLALRLGCVLEGGLRGQ